MTYKRPKCPKCIQSLSTIFCNQTKHIKIGYGCRQCKKIFLYKEWKTSDEKLFIGLKEVII